MTDLPLLATLALGLAVGVAAGGAFYGGLAWTVRHVPASSRPALLVTGSFTVRLLVVAGALLAAASWLPVGAFPAAVVGLLAARQLVVRSDAGSLVRRGGDGPWT